MRKFQVHVTQSDIDLAVPCTTHLCPIAIALARAISEDVWITGTLWYTASRFEGRRLPKKARAFIADFDHLEEVKPFSFEVKL